MLHLLGRISYLPADVDIIGSPVGKVVKKMTRFCKLIFNAGIALTARRGRI
jgi:hypothetical protein